MDEIHQQSPFNIFAELQRQYLILSDKENGLEERLEAFENIIDSEVGDTSLIRARNLERKTNVRQLYLKFEGGNPTGTQKDRIAFAQSMDAMRRGYDTITLATCGNYGVACAVASRAAGLRCVIFIPAAYQTRRIREMEELQAEIIRVPGDYEEAVAKSQEYAETKEVYDANPGGDNTTLQLRAYGQIAYEIYDELRDAPRIVASPVSNGTMLAGIYRGFLSLYRRGKTSRMPIMVAGSSSGKNPIVVSFLAGKKECEDLPPRKIKETLVNEPLINWHSFDGELAMQALWETSGWASNVADKQMLLLAKMLKESEGLYALPAATAGLAALINAPSPELVQNDRFVAIITSKK